MISLRHAMKILILVVSLPVAVYGSCVLPPPRETTIPIRNCTLVKPHKHPEITAFAKRYVESFHWSTREYYTKEAQEIVNSYRGALIETRNEDNSVATHFYPNEDDNVCTRFRKGANVKVVLRSACCDGDPNPPCLLGISSYVDKILDTSTSKGS